MSTLPKPDLGPPSEAHNKRLAARLSAVDNVLRDHNPSGDSDACLASVESLLRALGELDAMQATRTTPLAVVDAGVRVIWGGGPATGGLSLFVHPPPSPTPTPATLGRPGDPPI